MGGRIKITWQIRRPRRHEGPLEEISGSLRRQLPAGRKDTHYGADERFSSSSMTASQLTDESTWPTMLGDLREPGAFVGYVSRDGTAWRIPGDAVVGIVRGTIAG